MDSITQDSIHREVDSYLDSKITSIDVKTVVAEAVIVAGVYYIVKGMVRRAVKVQMRRQKLKQVS